MEMVTVEQAEALVNAQTRDYGAEIVHYATACGRVLAEDLLADRDFPPFNRATVDGIGINFSAFESGLQGYKIKATQAAGANPVAIAMPDACIEIMTGAAVHSTIDTIIRYEDINIDHQRAFLKDIRLRKGQNIHRRGSDHKKSEVMAAINTIITPATVGLAAAIGRRDISVKKLPKIVIITTGDELVGIDQSPNAYQLRQSNGATVSAVIEQYGIEADRVHLADDYAIIQRELSRCLTTYDVIIMCGGVSMGKFDYVPEALAALGARSHFQKVKQKPGKPFWFGTHGDQHLIFAFPGNPVSVFLCLHRYFVPWLHASLGLVSRTPEYAILSHDVTIPYAMQYFAQVKLSSGTQGQLLAKCIDGNGSGDFSKLIHTDAFMELPIDRDEFQAGEVHRIWRYVQSTYPRL